MSGLDAQRDIENEGQRAAIYHARKHALLNAPCDCSDCTTAEEAWEGKRVKEMLDRLPLMGGRSRPSPELQPVLAGLRIERVENGFVVYEDIPGRAGIRQWVVLNDRSLGDLVRQLMEPAGACGSR